MPITFATLPRTRLLSTRARVYARLGITGEDAKTDALLAAASDEAVTVLGYGIARAEVIETFAGGGWQEQVLGWAPLLELVSATYEGGAMDLADVAIVNPEAGIVRAFSGFTRGDRLDYALRCWAGWLTPADDLAGTTYSVVASDSSLNDSASGFPLLRPGDRIVVAGFTTAANNGTFTVVSRTAAKVVVAEAGLVDEAAGDAVTIAVSNLPADIEQAVIERVADLRSGSTTSAGGAVTSIEADGVKKSFSTSSTGTTRVSAYDRSLLRRARIAL